MDALLLSSSYEPERPIVPIQKGTKEHRAGVVFLQGRRLTRAEGWATLGDSCLNTTVSVLKNKHGIQIDRDWIDVPTRYGETTQVKLYWLAESSRSRLIESLGLEDGHGEEV